MKTLIANWRIWCRQENLWWSNEKNGWVNKEESTVFPCVEKERTDLPIGGEWIPSFSVTD